MFGIYHPYAEVTAKQKEAMTQAEVDYKYLSIYEITYNCLIKLLNSSQADSPGINASSLWEKEMK